MTHDRLLFNLLQARRNRAYHQFEVDDYGARAVEAHIEASYCDPGDRRRDEYEAKSWLQLIHRAAAQDLEAQAAQRVLLAEVEYLRWLSGDQLKGLDCE